MPDDAGLAAHGASRAQMGSGFVTLPNIITFIRLCMVPVAIWLVVHQRMMPAFWLFTAAGVSDAVDGWLARRGGATAIGAVIDPMADKTLLVGMYVTLAMVRVLPDWLAMLVVFRDLVIVGGVLALAVLGQPVPIRPLGISKLNTALQIGLVGVVLLLAGLGAADEPTLRAARAVLIWTVAGSTLASGAAYVVSVARPR